MSTALMRSVTAMVLLFGLGEFPANGLASTPKIVGRWDLTIGTPPSSYPSWLEVRLEGGTLRGRFVGESGSARPVSKLTFASGNLEFSLPPQYEKMKTDLVFEARLAGGRLTGTSRGEHGALPFVGVRAPALRTPNRPRWGQPQTLFDGKSLDGWKPKNPKDPFGWKVIDGVMENFMPSSDIVTERTFTDFKLHIEVNVAPKSNSGIYLRGRYEVQVQDDYGKPPESHLMGGVYGFIDPSENASKKAGEWQSYDITLLGRRVTVVLNGKTVISDKEIPGITGGALHSREGEPGPLTLQGDHGRVSYRNIVLVPVVK